MDRRVPTRCGQVVGERYVIKRFWQKIPVRNFKVLPPNSKIPTVALLIGISKKEEHFIIIKLHSKSISERIRKILESLDIMKDYYFEKKNYKKEPL